MSVTDVFSVIDATAGGDHVIRFTEQFVRQSPSYVTAAVMGWRPSFPIPEAATFDELLGQWMAAVQKDLELDVQTVRARLDRENTASSVEGLFVELKDVRSAIGMRARHADLSIVSRPRPVAYETAAAILEGALLTSGRPVIVVPPGWTSQEFGRTVLICWKPTREAARTIADAAAIIRAAQRVVVVTVDARPSEAGYGPAPGADICAHLARVGAKVELINLTSAGRSETNAIQDQALAVGADMVVMGGYGRSRMEEFIFGGVTRAMLAESETPLFMSH